MSGGTSDIGAVDRELLVSLLMPTRPQKRAREDSIDLAGQVCISSPRARSEKVLENTIAALTPKLGVLKLRVEPTRVIQA